MKVGILGGGQLSRMLALAGIPLGLEFCFYEPKAESCVASLGQVIYGAYDEEEKLQQFAEQVDLITYENESIPAATLSFLEKLRPVYPDKKALIASQDRLAEKNLFQALSIPTAQYQPVNSKAELLTLLAEMSFPLFLKKRHGGYDGKGQRLLMNKKDAEAVPEEFCQDALIESYVDFVREVSLIAARNRSGHIEFYDLSENRHRNGILFRTVNRIQDPQFELAVELVDRIMEELQYVGVLAVEFFQQGERLLANEMAPRVHNSGHWTIEGAETSQFENHLRAILDWPLGKTGSRCQATLYNILGEFPAKEQLLKYPRLHLHDYQKSPLPGRKIGHVTLLAEIAHNYPKTLENLLFGERGE